MNHAEAMANTNQATQGSIPSGITTAPAQDHYFSRNVSSRGYIHPRRHRAKSVSSRHSMIRGRFECTASISTDTTGDPGGSGSMTFVTRKCFSLLRGATAVHFV
jgi:hypothetical protein